MTPHPSGGTPSARPQDAPLGASAWEPLIEAAQQATASGDEVSAESLLREGARLQEAKLGPLHPDLASTNNNLGVLCERANKLADAEQFFRRAYAIASASLDSHHPLVATSRDNLRDFCDAHCLPLDRLPAAESVAVPVVEMKPRPSTAATVMPPASATPPEGAKTASRATRPSRVLITGGLAATAVLVTLIGAWSLLAPRDLRAPENVPHSAVAPVSVPAPGPPAAAPASPAAVSPRSPTEPAIGRVTTTGEASPVRPVAPSPERPVRSARATVADTAAARGTDVRVIEAAVCRSLSTSVSPWRCEAPSGPTASGPLYFYTRIATPTDVRVHHRWYRGDRLRQDVELAVAASPGAGYRTYSRLRVDTGGEGDWRVELVTGAGVLLHEERIVSR